MKPNPPFRYSYWVVPGKLLAGCYPGSIDPSRVDEQVSGLIDAGVTLVVNLMEVSEMELFQRFYETYETVLPDLAKVKGRPVSIKRFPIPDRSIPSIDEMSLILQTIHREVDAEGVVYVHCLGGIGRTGTVVGCHFAQEGHPSPLEHLQALTDSEKEYFWPTPQTEEQRQFVLNWRRPAR